ncbi:MAG: 50S ribosomal protein L18 [Bacteroidetes bacterium]|nr:50S ribosomal protein L18 [Bacteroidota bacterium]MBU1422243.1 50S ribosomal protein L18 [Bacteroidota bacterium]MBU2636015.1 50S ribosomal protein L18 [Bacteroidota bacterium]MDI6779242.1 50S ribosomal protein L18 [Bacteroidota bacterium]
MIKKDRTKKRNKIKKHIKKTISGTTEKPRLAVYRSLKHLYAQLIDDTKGNTIAYVSTRSKEVVEDLKDKKGRIEQAKIVGLKLAKKALEKNIQQVVFDRSGYKYHGKVKAIADGAREGGLVF